MANTEGPSQEKACSNGNAESPYDSAARYRDGSADIILRSSDLIDFYVFKGFLSYVSSVFRVMFDLPSTTTNEMMNGLPVIAVAETSETIRLLLDLIYPHMDKPQIDNVAQFRKVCKATRKYCMVIIENRLRKQIVTSDLTVSEPLRVYAVALELDWEDVALIAARNASNISLDKLPHAEELGNISASGFYWFLDYKFRRDKEPFQDYLKLFPVASIASAPSVQVQSRARQDAQKPFDITAKADVILRSKDLVDFYVLEDLVRVASSSDTPFPFGIASGETSANGLTIINVAEDSEVLFHLLSFIYPISDELDILNCRLYVQVVLAARRYGITIIETRFLTRAAASPFILKEPLRMYIVALALGWAELAKSAAINTLSSPLQDMSYMDELSLITGADLYRLVSFRFRCADAACNVINYNASYKANGPGRWALDKSGKLRHHGPADELFKKLKSCPRGSIIKNACDLEDRSLSQISQITLNGPDFIKILGCRREIEHAVEAAVAKVPFHVCISQ